MTFNWYTIGHNIKRKENLQILQNDLFSREKYN